MSQFLHSSKSHIVRFDKRIAYVLALFLLCIGLPIVSPNQGIGVIVLLTMFVGLLLLQSTQVAVLGLLALLPFIDFFKRLVFVEPMQSTAVMYAPLFLTDVLLAGILLLSWPQLAKRLVPSRFPKLDLWVLLFIGWATLSSLIFTNPQIPLFNRVSIVELKVVPIFMYFVGAIWLSNRQMSEHWARIVVVAALVATGYGIVQFWRDLFPYERAWVAAFEAGQINSAAVRHILLDRRVLGFFRVFATTSDHVSFGAFLGVAMWFWYGILPGKRTPLFLIGMLFLSIGIFLSFTRMVYILPIVIGMVYFLLYYAEIRPIINLRKVRTPLVVITLLACSYLLFALIFTQLYGTKLFGGYGDNPYLKRLLNTSSLEARLRTDDLFSQDRLSLAGHGLSATGQNLRRSGVIGMDNNDTQDVNFHNMFFDMAEEMGLIGVGIFLGLLYHLYRNSLNYVNAKMLPSNRRIPITLLSIITGLLIIAQIDRALFWAGELWPYYFWAMVGAVANFSLPSSTPNSPHES